MTKIHIYIVLIISLLVVACESDSDIVLRPASQSAVMTSFIYVDSVATVNVYGAVSVSDTQRIATLGDVEVKLTCGDISRLHYLEEGETRALFADMTLREGDTVEVEVVRYAHIQPVSTGGTGNSLYDYYFGNGSSSAATTLAVDGGYEMVKLNVTLKYLD